MIMYSKKILKAGIIIVLTTLMVPSLDSCKIIQPYSRPDFVQQGSLYRDQTTQDTSNISTIPWKNIFNDQQLISLVDEALNNNPDMRIAAIRMKKAEATLKQSTAAFFPSLNANANATLQGTDGTKTSENYQVSANSSWQVDILGRLRNTRRGNLDLFLQSEAYTRAVKTQLISDVAISYYSLLALDEQLSITEKTVENRKAEVETLKVMMQSDMVTGADLAQSQASLYSAQVRIPDLKQSIYEAENALSTLLGRNPGPVKRGSIFDEKINIDLKTGIPAQLLANRPDVQEAEYQLRYGYEMTNLARKNFYPVLTISAAAGYPIGSVNDIFNPASVFWNLIGGLTQPLFNQGLNRQRLKIAKANQEENIENYKKTLLQAEKEVANSINGYQTTSEKIGLRTQQITYLEKAVDYTMELLKYTSTTNYNDVLSSEVALLSAQLNSVDDKFQQLQYVINLYAGLGGGWR